MAEQALYPAVNLRAAASYKPHTLRGSKKCLDLNQTQLLGSKHADHPSSACPLRLLQAHLALESTPPLRLILRWTRVGLDRVMRDQIASFANSLLNCFPFQEQGVTIKSRASFSSMVLLPLIFAALHSSPNLLSRAPDHPGAANPNIWPSQPPAGIPFEQSRDLAGIAFTGRYAQYGHADTWYPSWAADGNLYSPWTDGEVNGVKASSGGAAANTGFA